MARALHAIEHYDRSSLMLCTSIQCGGGGASAKRRLQWAAELGAVLAAASWSALTAAAAVRDTGCVHALCLRRQVRAGQLPVHAAARLGRDLPARRPEWLG